MTRMLEAASLLRRLKVRVLLSLELGWHRTMLTEVLFSALPMLHPTLSAMLRALTFCMMVTISVRWTFVLHVAFLLRSHATLRNNKCDAGTIMRELTLHGVKHGSIKLSITYEKLD